MQKAPPKQCLYKILFTLILHLCCHSLILSLLLGAARGKRNIVIKVIAPGHSLRVEIDISYSITVSVPNINELCMFRIVLIGYIISAWCLIIEPVSFADPPVDFDL